MPDADVAVTQYVLRNGQARRLRDVELEERDVQGRGSNILEVSLARNRWRTTLRPCIASISLGD